MFPELNNLLNVSPEKPEQGTFTLLCDAKTDGSFLVHHFLSFYLKEFTDDNWLDIQIDKTEVNQGEVIGGPTKLQVKANCKVCFVALLQSFSHYNIVGQKLGINLITARDRGQLVFLEGLKSTVEVLFGSEEQPNTLKFIRESGSDLKSLYELVQKALTPSGDGDAASWKFPVLLVDDLSVLLSVGVQAVAILDFIHSCRVNICCQLKGNVVALVHGSDRTEDEENAVLMSALGHQSSLILRAEGLVTGFCKDVHGQLKILWRGLQRPKVEQSQSLIYQYKIQDKSVTFFAKGLSPAVL